MSRRVHVHTRPVHTINGDVTNTSNFSGTIASILPVEIEAVVNTGRGGDKTRDRDLAVERERILRRVGGKGDVAVRAPVSPSSCSCETVIFTKWDAGSAIGRARCWRDVGGVVYITVSRRSARLATDWKR